MSRRLSMTHNLVSIHAPAWRATRRTGRSGPCLKFQSTPPHGGRLHDRFTSVSLRCFNPRPRMEGDEHQIYNIGGKKMFQSTPPHGGRHILANQERALIVSIHAPAWRATSTRAALHRDRGFNPRPRMEGDQQHRHRPRKYRFQSTPPHGGRHFFGDHAGLRRSVSIHAPAWRATGGSAGCAGQPMFQSTPPHGGRRPLPRASSAPPRVSIHAPAWRATRVVHRAQHPARVSIHAPAWRATKGGARKGRAEGVSIHAPAWRATRRTRSAWPAILFQSTPPHGGRHSLTV